MTIKNNTKNICIGKIIDVHNTDLIRVVDLKETMVGDIIYVFYGFRVIKAKVEKLESEWLEAVLFEKQNSLLVGSRVCKPVGILSQVLIGNSIAELCLMHEILTSFEHNEIRYPIGYKNENTLISIPEQFLEKIKLTANKLYLDGYGGSKSTLVLLNSEPSVRLEQLTLLGFKLNKPGQFSVSVLMKGYSPTELVLGVSIGFTKGSLQMLDEDFQFPYILLTAEGENWYRENDTTHCLPENVTSLFDLKNSVFKELSDKELFYNCFLEIEKIVTSTFPKKKKKKLWLRLLQYMIPSAFSNFSESKIDEKKLQLSLQCLTPTALLFIQDVLKNIGLNPEEFHNKSYLTVRCQILTHMLKTLNGILSFEIHSHPNL